MDPCCEQTHAAFEVGLSLDQGQGVYSGRSDVVGSSQVRLCHTCIIDVMDTWTCSDTQTKSLCTIPSEKYSFHIVRRWGSSNQGSPGVGKHHVNNKKTKFLVSAVGPGVLKKSGKYPVLSAAVVLVSAIIPSHARSASCGSTRGAAASLVADPNSYMCNGKSGPIDGWPMTQVDVNCTMLDVVDIFCCLGDILCSGWALGKVQETIATRHLVPNAPITPVYALVTILDFDQIVWQRP